MKKIMYLLIIPLIVLCLVGCDAKPPKEEDLKSWLNRKTNDNYKILSTENTSNINPDDYMIKFECESQYGFEFYATVSYGYVERKDGGCGDQSGYERRYESNYDEKLAEYIEDDLKAIEEKYDATINRSDGYTYYFHVNKYADIQKLNNFAYEYYDYIKTHKIKTTSKQIMVVCVTDGSNATLDLKYLYKNKDKHLKELQYYYINEVQKGKIEDNTIPKAKTVTIEKWYIDDTLINDIIDYPPKIFYVPEIGEYGINIDRYELRNDKLLSTIIEKVYKEDYEEDDNNVARYKINGKSYKVTFTSNGFKVNKEKVEYKEPPLYYPNPMGMGRKERIVTLEDFSKLIDCTYKVKGDEIYFYTK